MADFPVLKTGAIAQYGTDRTQRLSTSVFRFLDGSEQRFPGYPSSLKQWVIRLDLLDENEMARLIDFFESIAGRAGVFAFTDPWDGIIYANCSFDEDILTAHFSAEGRGQMAVTVKENRG